MQVCRIASGEMEMSGPVSQVCELLGLGCQKNGLEFRPGYASPLGLAGYADRPAGSTARKKLWCLAQRQKFLTPHQIGLVRYNPATKRELGTSEFALWVRLEDEQEIARPEYGFDTRQLVAVADHYTNLSCMHFVTSMKEN
ncbi:hypothetical protein IP78_04665 [Brevundimonas sp. AAP58]|nr:hypothetical protein IP78_04665 [Brevundimonas sp. AAP58]